MAPCAHSLCDRSWAVVVRRPKHKQRFGHAFLAPVGTRALRSRLYLAISARLGWIPGPCLEPRWATPTPVNSSYSVHGPSVAHQGFNVARRRMTHTDTPRMTHTQTPQARFWTQTLRKGPSGVRRARRTNTPQARLWTQTLRQGPSGVSRDRRTNTRRGRRVRRSKAHLRLAKPVERQHRE